ncbi:MULTISPECIES: hypothetical protein [unclassified Bradyrhizobium]|uniref:hypothetical protein n=1 Tax=unclassified Bradyrhizobium TaxID=2631580 RepID=UPI002916E69D|nr:MULTISPECIES: hypothetical protein [unclassified Bradyrhizobium]
MRLWEHTFEELTGGEQPQGDRPEPFIAQPFVGATVVPITQNPRYATAVIPGSKDFGHQALLEWRDGSWVCVGHYVDDTIQLDVSVRGMGLAEELVLRCVEHRHSLPLTTGFTNRGFRLLRRAHRLAVERALQAGLPVPQNVRDETVL